VTIIDTAQISQHARKVDPGRALLTLVFLLPFLLGWIAGATVYASTWLWAAMLVGWRTGRQHDQHNTTADWTER
jgi:hypothetical protein